MAPLWVRAARVWARFRFGVGVRARVRVQHADLLVLDDDALARHVAARVQAAHQCVRLATVVDDDVPLALGLHKRGWRRLVRVRVRVRGRVGAAPG